MILSLETLHGIKFALFHVAAIAFVADKTPIELEATGQYLVVGLERLGRFIFMAIGGFILQNWGGSYMYAVASAFVLLSLSSYLLVERYIDWSSSEEAETA